MKELITQRVRQESDTKGLDERETNKYGTQPQYRGQNAALFGGTQRFQVMKYVLPYL